MKITVCTKCNNRVTIDAITYPGGIEKFTCRYCSNAKYMLAHIRTQKQRAASRINGRKGGRPGKYNIGLECLAIAICKGIDIDIDLQSIGRVPETLLYKLRAELIAAAIQ